MKTEAKNALFGHHNHRLSELSGVIMMTSRSSKSSGPATSGPPDTQRGSVLIISLIMLLLISLVGIGSMQGTVLQERMASNLQDRNIAFQAAERALRVGENWVRGSAAVAANQDLLVSPEDWDGNGVDAVTVATGDPQLSDDPDYHAGWLADFCPSLAVPPTCFERFAVTSRAQGGSANSVVILQTVQMPPP
jgi:type IV pilus assembly protein PilX